MSIRTSLIEIYKELVLKDQNCMGWVEADQIHNEYEMNARHLVKHLTNDEKFDIMILLYDKSLWVEMMFYKNALQCNLVDVENFLRKSNHALKCRLEPVENYLRKSNQ